MQAQQGPHEPIKQAKAINYKYTQIYYYSYAKWSPLCVRQRKHCSGGQVREQQQAKRGLCPSHCSSAPNKGASSCFPLCPTTTGHCLQPSILSAASHTIRAQAQVSHDSHNRCYNRSCYMWHGPLCADKIQNAQQHMQARRRCKKEHTN